MVIRLLILFVLVASCGKNDVVKKDRTYDQFVVDNKLSSYYSGCIDGFMGVYELGAYERPKEWETAREAFGNIKKMCVFKSYIYEYHHTGGPDRW